MRRDYSSLRQGLLGAWCPSLGATGYTLLDRSGRGNNGTLTNMGGQGDWRASGSGTAINLDGSNDFVNLGSPSYLNFGDSDYSFSLWVCFPSLPTATSTILGKDAVTGRQFGLQRNVDSAASLVGEIMWTSVNSNGSYHGQRTGVNNLVAGVWAHVMCGRAGSSLVLYVNGVKQTTYLYVSSDALSTMNSTTTPLYIGARVYSGFENYSNMSFDDVRFYNRVLTRQEISLLASRRGIGLTPVRQRRTSASSRRLYANVAGTWKQTFAMVNVSGTWKEGAVYENVGGVWKN